MNIRFGAIHDLAAVQSLNKSLVLYERQFVPNGQIINERWSSQPDGTDHFTKYLKGESGTVIILAETGGQIVGYLAASCSSSPHRLQNPVAVIETMFIEESHRRQGVGSKLVTAFMDWAKTNKAEHLETLAWSSNHEAREFYSRFGFIEDAIRLTRASKEK